MWHTDAFSTHMAHLHRHIMHAHRSTHPLESLSSRSGRVMGGWDEPSCMMMIPADPWTPPPPSLQSENRGVEKQKGTRCLAERKTCSLTTSMCFTQGHCYMNIRMHLSVMACVITGD